MKELKIEFYDAFHCIADQCSLTCCQEWRIEVDPTTHNKWKKLGIEEHVKAGDGVGIIELNQQKKCPFLNNKKFCNLVTQYGEEILSKTCTTFPREIKEFEKRREYSLVTCCPEVVDMLRKANTIEFSNDLDSMEEGILFQVRTLLIDILKNTTYSIAKSMMICFYILLELKEKEKITENVIKGYQEKGILKELSDAIDQMEFSARNTFEENNELFLDLAVNYRMEELYTDFLESIATLSEAYSNDFNEIELKKDLKVFEETISEYEPLFRNYLISEVFNNVLMPESNFENMVMKFQWMALEFGVIRHTVFLQWVLSGKGEIPYNILRDSIVIVSRMTGYDDADIVEYLSTCFQSVIWEWGYLALLIGNK